MTIRIQIQYRLEYRYMTIRIQTQDRLEYRHGTEYNTDKGQI